MEENRIRREKICKNMTRIMFYIYMIIMSLGFMLLQMMFSYKTNIQTKIIANVATPSDFLTIIEMDHEFELIWYTSITFSCLLIIVFSCYFCMLQTNQNEACDEEIEIKKIKKSYREMHVTEGRI